MPRISATTAILILALIAILLTRLVFSSRHRHTYGLPVALVHSCSASELERLGDSRDIWVRYLPGDRAFVNELPMTHAEAIPAVSDAMSRRWERVVWIAGDPHLTYGEVIANTARLKAQIPSLVVLLTTGSQTGPVDPAAIVKLPLDQRFFPLCLPPRVSNQLAVP